MTEETPFKADDDETPAIADDDRDVFDLPEGATGARVEVQKDGDKYYWVAFAENGRPVATGPESHKKLSDLKRTVQGIADWIGDAPFIRLY